MRDRDRRREKDEEDLEYLEEEYGIRIKNRKPSGKKFSYKTERSEHDSEK